MPRCSTPACPTRGRDLTPNEIEYYPGLNVYICKLCEAELEGYAPGPGAGAAPAPATPQPPPAPTPRPATAPPAPPREVIPAADPWEITIPEPPAPPPPPPSAPRAQEAAAPASAATPPPPPQPPAADSQPPADWPLADDEAGAAVEDEFSLAGALAFPRLEVYQGQKLRGEYEVRGDVFTIGRFSSRQAGIPDLDFGAYADGGQVSRQHARLVQDSGAYYIEDLASKSGTWLNGALLEARRRYELHDGDEIAIGEVASLIFRLP